MTWTAPPMFDALKEIFDNWGDLTGVKIFTAPMAKAKALENVQLFSAPGDQKWTSLGARSKEDSYVIEGLVEVVRKGAGEDIAKSARDRVREIMAALEDALRDLANRPNGMRDLATAVGATQITELALASISLFQGATQDGNRLARAPFDIEVKARI